jgi:hypothetical protein
MESKNTSKEVIFSKWVRNNKPLIKKDFKIDVVGIEVKIPKTTNYLSGASLLGNNCGIAFGSIDFIFNFRNKLYICECKYPTEKTNSHFWESLKVLGYTSYCNWMSGSKKKYLPAIMLPENKITIEYEIVCRELDIKIFRIIENKDDYIIIEKNAHI